VDLAGVGVAEIGPHPPLDRLRLAIGAFQHSFAAGRLVAVARITTTACCASRRGMTPTIFFRTSSRLRNPDSWKFVGGPT
jgi:hypothetical protein